MYVYAISRYVYTYLYYMYVNAYVNKNTHAYIYIHTYAYIGIYIYIETYICTSMHTYKYMLHIYIHTYIIPLDWGIGCFTEHFIDEIVYKMPHPATTIQTASGDLYEMLLPSIL